MASLALEIGPANLLPKPWTMPAQGLAVYYGCPQVHKLSHYFLPRVLLEGKRVLYLDGANHFDPQSALRGYSGHPFFIGGKPSLGPCCRNSGTEIQLGHRGDWKEKNRWSRRPAMYRIYDWVARLSKLRYAAHAVISVKQIPDEGFETVVGRQSQGISGDLGIIRQSFRRASSAISSFLHCELLGSNSSGREGPREDRRTHPAATCKNFRRQVTPHRRPPIRRSLKHCSSKQGRRTVCPQTRTSCSVTSSSNN